MDVHAGERVLDVAAGSGNAALAAARRGARVIASDIARVALERARQRADAEGLALHTELADAQALPFDDAAFDVVLSTFGAMFAPDRQQVADELTRVCRPGGRIGLANWMPEGLVGSSLAIIDQHVPSAPAAAELRSPSAWGTAVRRALVGDQVTELRTRRRSTDVCAASAADLVAFNRACAGPRAPHSLSSIKPGRSVWPAISPRRAKPICQVAGASSTGGHACVAREANVVSQGASQRGKIVDQVAQHEQIDEVAETVVGAVGGPLADGVQLLGDLKSQR